MRGDPRPQVGEASHRPLATLMAASLGLIGLEGDWPKLAQSKADLSAINRKTSVLLAGVLGGDLHLTLLGGLTHRRSKCGLSCSYSRRRASRFWFATATKFFAVPSA